MYMCLWVSQFSLQCQVRKRSDMDGMAVVLVSGQGRSSLVEAVNNVAQSKDVAAGFSLARARARCGERIQVLQENPTAMREVQVELLQWAENLVVEYENTANGCVILNLRSLQFKQEANLCQWLEHSLQLSQDLHMEISLAVAHTPDLAQVASRYASTSFKSPSDLKYFSQRSLVFGSGYATLQNAEISSVCELFGVDYRILQSWGIRSVAEFLALGKHELVLRLGEDILDMFEILSGERHRLLQLYQVVQRFTKEVHLEFPIRVVEALVFVLQRTFVYLCQELQEKGLACQYFTLVLVNEQMDTIERRLKLPEPSCQAEVFRMLLQPYLEGLRIEAPLVSFFLHLEATPHSHAERDMFSKQLRDPNRFSITLADIRNTLGEENVGMIAFQNTHAVDSERIIPWFLKDTEVVEKKMLGLPLSKIRPPMKIEVIEQLNENEKVPLAILSGTLKGKIRELSGPYKLVGDWWELDQRWNQKEWDVVLETGQILRISFDLERKTWWLDGKY
jgi:protein ImuB